VAQFLVQADGFDRGTRLLVTGPTTGAVEFTADEIFDDNGPVNHATKGTAVTIKVPEKVRENDKLYVLQPRQ
jgi:putative protease